ncbi:Gfo/Idh/MocA family protein [Rugosimonospora africana]|uniref:Oxidoreductase n=1 Tax=Rugosimonospora africana TaxID=556532 RepID=A0A8J3QPV0_9ACTN|nr:Gfo/Idh/MocA family oxidoreductase [Rugosimonospora africana]GIH14744.1 oxidoreductase [Rugosimonospora africana]
MSVGVAIVGCGTISHEYLRNLTTFPDVRVLVCADLDTERAKAVAGQYGVPTAGEPELALRHPDVELVVNLTIPAAHVEVSAAAIALGKHVYSEKPLALDPDSGARLLAAAAEAGVRVGAAPDTFLGAGLQSAIRFIGQGGIGDPRTALTLLQGPGPQRWHPSPEFLFQQGAGPLFDLGPYYLTALAAVFGPVTRVAATAGQAFGTRVIGSGPRAGTEFAVEVPTHVSCLMEYRGGQSATSIFSFDSPLSRQGFLEITGTEATLSVPDPNRFDGPLSLRRAGDDDWTPVETRGASVGRGMGVLDLARAIRTGTPHRADAAAALHVVEVMAAVAQSAERGEFVTVHGEFPTPAPLPEDWDPRERTL